MKTGISMVELNHKRKVKAANQRKLIKQQEAKIINQRDIIKGLLGKGEWVDTNVKLPENICTILAYGNGMIYFAFYNSSGEWCMENEKLENITHWMPLPKPPV